MLSAKCLSRFDCCIYTLYIVNKAGKDEAIGADSQVGMSSSGVNINPGSGLAGNVYCIHRSVCPNLPPHGVTSPQPRDERAAMRCTCTPRPAWSSSGRITSVCAIQYSVQVGMSSSGVNINPGSGLAGVQAGDVLYIF